MQAPIFAFGREAGDTRCVLYPDFTFGPGGWPLAYLPSWEDFRCLLPPPGTSKKAAFGTEESERVP